MTKTRRNFLKAAPVATVGLVAATKVDSTEDQWHEFSALHAGQNPVTVQWTGDFNSKADVAKVLATSIAASGIATDRKVFLKLEF